MTILARIDRPQDLHSLSEDELVQVAQEVRELLIDTVGEIGGHFGANLGTCEIAVALHSLLDSPTRQDPLGRRPPGLPAQDPHRPPRRARHDPQVRRPRPVLRDPRVRARHHGRRARLDLDRLRRRDQGGDAPRRRGRRQGRRGDRRRRDDRRRRLRGDPPGRRARHAARGDPQRQRHVDLAERRRAVALLQPRPARAGAVEGARGHGGEAHEAAGRHRRARSSASARSSRSRSRRSGRPACCGRSSTGPTWASIDGHDVRALRARPARRVRGRAPRGGPLRHRQGQGLRARRGRRARGDGEVARREAELDREADARPVQARGRRPEAAAVHAGVRRGARGRVRARPPRRRHHRGDELRHRAQPAPEGDARPLLRRRHRRAAGGAVRGGPGAAGLAPGGGDLLDVPAARLRPDRPRRLPAAAAGRPRHGPRGARRRRRPDAPRRVRHRVPALRCRT